MKYIIYLFTMTALLSSCSLFKPCCPKEEKASAGKVQESTMKTDAELEAEIAKQSENGQPVDLSKEYAEMINNDIPDNVMARIQRTACFGRCPIYTLTVFKDGKIEYFGMKFTPRNGRFEGKVDQAVVDDILVKANEFGFFGMKDEYDKPAITDLPSTITSIRNRDGLKTVVSRFDSPKNLRTFEKYLDSIAEGVDWKPYKREAQNQD